jgi:peptide/nickel transport system substrate-binding protein
LKATASPVNDGSVRARYWAPAAILLGLMLAGGALAGPHRPALRGGTMRINLSATDVDFTDPSLAYGTISWQIEYATALKLINYPDRPKPAGTTLRPEAAVTLPTISKTGKQYTFKIRSGLRLSDGSRVTARNFAAAIARVRDPRMRSPGAGFVRTLTGMRATGNTLVLRLSRPEPRLLSRLAMPFFQAIPTNLPHTPVVTYPSGGPYYIATRTPNKRIELRRNTFYNGSRPNQLDGYDITVNTNLNQSFFEVASGAADYDLSGVPANANAVLAQQYGVNTGQYQVHPLHVTDYLVFNTSRAAFSNVRLRKAANYAIDRPAMLRVRGAFAGERTDQILPPGMPGFRDANLYPLNGADLTTARGLAGNNCGPITLYTTGSAVGQALGNEVKTDLAQIGCTVSFKYYPTVFDVIVAAGHRGEPFDAALVTWTTAWPDPYDFVDILLNGNNIRANNNTNLSYFNSAAVNKLLVQASRLTGPARYQRYGNLDVLITKNYAPWAAYDNRNEREFISKRVGGYLFQPANASADLNTFFLK